MLRGMKAGYLWGPGILVSLMWGLLTVIHVSCCMHMVMSSDPKSLLFTWLKDPLSCAGFLSAQQAKSSAQGNLFWPWTLLPHYTCKGVIWIDEGKGCSLQCQEAGRERAVKALLYPLCQPLLHLLGPGHVLFHPCRDWQKSGRKPGLSSWFGAYWLPLLTFPICKVRSWVYFTRSCENKYRLKQGVRQIAVFSATSNCTMVPMV
jgi:hypothetical protein